MAVGKGSMARASKAAGKKSDTKAAVIAKADEEVMDAVVTVNADKVAVEQVVEATTEKKTAPKKAAAKPTGKKGATKKVTPKKETAVVEKTDKVATAAVVEATSEQVMKEIVYQKSAQVLDREPEVNETFGIGEAMPIYLF